MKGEEKSFPASRVPVTITKCICVESIFKYLFLNNVSFSFTLQGIIDEQILLLKERNTYVEIRKRKTLPLYICFTNLRTCWLSWRSRFEDHALQNFLYINTFAYLQQILDTRKWSGCCSLCHSRECCCLEKFACGGNFHWPSAALVGSKPSSGLQPAQRICHPPSTIPTALCSSERHQSDSWNFPSSFLFFFLVWNHFWGINSYDWWSGRDIAAAPPS